MDNLRTDCMLSEILEERKSLTGFLDTIFEFLSRKTDFYHVQQTKDEKMGFPRGIKEQIILSCMQKYDEKVHSHDLISPITADENIPPPAYEEIEIETESFEAISLEPQPEEDTNFIVPPKSCEEATNRKTDIFTQNEYKNGAIFDTYCWSQTLKDVELTVALPAKVKTSKHMKMDLKSTYITMKCLVPHEQELIYGKTWDKYKHNDVVWTIGDGKLTLSFDKSKECWWDKLFTHESTIDIKKLDTDRHITDFPEDTQREIEKIQTEGIKSKELKDLKTLPLSKSEQLARLKQAWNADDSPFKGQSFDPSVIQFN